MLNTPFRIGRRHLERYSSSTRPLWPGYRGQIENRSNRRGRERFISSQPAPTLGSLSYKGLVYNTT